MPTAYVISFASHSLELLDFDVLKSIVLPLFASYISAGFPSPADVYLED